MADASLLTAEDGRDCSLTQTNKGTHLIGHEAITGLSELKVLLMVLGLLERLG